MEQTLTPEVLEELKTQLQTKKTQLEGELSGFATKDPNMKGDWDTKYPRVPQGNLEEAADEVEEYSTNLHVEFSLETQLKDVTDALERVEKGTYGMCQNCGETVSLERLKAFPEAKTCGKCAT
ncbi:MAG TPA: TraR/DksA C4-type zinc finger protein [Candidatus Paceibacterota bacterium]